MNKGKVLLYKFLKRIFGYENRIVFERPVRCIDYKPSIPLDLRAGGYRDILNLDEKMGYDEEARAYAWKRSQAGDVGVFAYHGENLAGYKWAMLNELEMPFGKTLTISPDRFYLYKTFTAEGYRGLQISTILDSFIEKVITREHPSKGYCLTWVFNNNPPSLRSAEKIGYKVVGHIQVVDFLYFRRYWMSQHLLSTLTSPHDDFSRRSDRPLMAREIPPTLKQPSSSPSRLHP